MGIRRTFDEADMQSDLIATGRPLGVQSWTDPHGRDKVLLTFQVDQILKGAANAQSPGLIQILADEPLPTSNVADIEHVLFLINRAHLNELVGIGVEPEDAYLYYLTDGYQSIYANVNGHVVAAEYGALKQTGLRDLYSLRLDGTSFDDLVTRIENGPHVAEASGTVIAQRGYFAC